MNKNFVKNELRIGMNKSMCLAIISHTHKRKSLNQHEQKRRKWKCNYCAQGNLLEVIDNKTVRR